MKTAEQVNRAEGVERGQRALSRTARRGLTEDSVWHMLCLAARAHPLLVVRAARILVLPKERESSAHKQLFLLMLSAAISHFGRYQDLGSFRARDFEKILREYLQVTFPDPAAFNLESLREAVRPRGKGA